MTPDTPSDPNYSVLITKRADGFELRIEELLISARAATFEAAYRELLEQKAEILEWTRTLGLVDQLPPPRVLPAAAAKLKGGPADRG